MAGEPGEPGARRREADQQHIRPQLAREIKISEQAEGVLAQEGNRVRGVLAGANPFLRQEWGRRHPAEIEKHARQRAPDPQVRVQALHQGLRLPHRG